MRKQIVYNAQGKWMTLGELREFVRETEELPPETRVHSQTTFSGYLKQVQVRVSS